MNNAIEKCKSMLFEKHGIVPYTIYITLWDDNDFVVKLQATLFPENNQFELINSNMPYQVERITIVISNRNGEILETMTSEILNMQGRKQIA